ncbi:glycosyltransferase, partial [Sutterella massiliensis]|nr:glycosyltransferase [Sutterella massiliensis]
MPKISVIVPVYNGEKFINKCLDSLLFQDLKDIEIIVINDGSVD